MREVGLRLERVAARDEPLPCGGGVVVFVDAREVREEVLAVGDGGYGVVGIVGVHGTVADEALGEGGGDGGEEEEQEEEEEEEEGIGGAQGLT